jgi:hypothetical protein
MPGFDKNAKIDVPRRLQRAGPSFLWSGKGLQVKKLI